MNERIKLLAEQAEDYAIAEYEKWTPTEDFSGVPHIRNIFNEKFAELIVLDCMNQVREQYLPVLEDKAMMKDRHWDGYVQCGVDSVVGIREYFYGEEGMEDQPDEIKHCPTCGEEWSGTSCGVDDCGWIKP